MVYRTAMGTVMRCASCDHVVIRVARGRGRYWIDLQGTRGLRVDEAPSV